MNRIGREFLDYLQSEGASVKITGGVFRWDGKFAESESSHHLLIGWQPTGRPTDAWIEEIVRWIVGFQPYETIRKKLHLINSQKCGTYIGDWLVTLDSSDLSFRRKRIVGA